MTTPTQYVLTPPRGVENPVKDLTNSSINTFMECPRKYELMYVEGLRPEREADYFRIGGAYHLAHEVHGKTGSVDAAVEAIYENYRNPPEYIESDETLLAKWYYEATTCVCLFRGWAEYYSDRQDYLEPVSVVETEQVFDVPIRSPYDGSHSETRRKGKIDKIVILRDGRVALVEYKTSGEDIELGSDYWWRLKIESQPSGYYVASRFKGRPIQTVVYDVARKPMIRPTVVPLVEDGARVVLDMDGVRVRTKDGKKWRETGDSSMGYVLQTRPMELAEWEAKLMADIRSRFEHYYVRDEITRLDSDLHDYEVDLWNQHLAITEAARFRRFYRNTRSCTGRTRCPMFAICTGRVGAGDDGVPEGYRRAENMHEELEG